MVTLPNGFQALHRQCNHAIYPADAAGTETVGTHIASICAKGSAYWIAISDGT
jgi:predicted RNA binding protein YcfA (HicA-like mRNA interferase family)